METYRDQRGCSRLLIVGAKRAVHRAAATQGSPNPDRNPNLSLGLPDLASGA